jgi:hypothetical protein
MTAAQLAARLHASCLEAHLPAGTLGAQPRHGAAW